MRNLNTVLSKLNDRLLRLEGELFVLRSIARAALTAGDESAVRTRKLLEGARLALWTKPSGRWTPRPRSTSRPRSPWSKSCSRTLARRRRCSG